MTCPGRLGQLRVVRQLELLPTSGLCQRWRDRKARWYRDHAGAPRLDRRRYHVEPISQAAAAAWLAQHHHLRTLAGRQWLYGLLDDRAGDAASALVGVAVFGPGMPDVLPALFRGLRPNGVNTRPLHAATLASGTRLGERAARTCWDRAAYLLDYTYLTCPDRATRALRYRSGFARLCAPESRRLPVYLDSAAYRVSRLFRAARAYAERHYGPGQWLILSALQGLVDPDTVLAPYDLSLRQLSAREREAWGNRVAVELTDRLPARHGAVVPRRGALPRRDRIRRPAPAAPPAGWPRHRPAARLVSPARLTGHPAAPLRLLPGRGAGYEEVGHAPTPSSAHTERARDRGRGDLPAVRAARRHGHS